MAVLGGMGNCDLKREERYLVSTKQHETFGAWKMFGRLPTVQMSSSRKKFSLKHLTLTVSMKKKNSMHLISIYMSYLSTNCAPFPPLFLPLV